MKRLKWKQTMPTNTRSPVLNCSRFALIYLLFIFITKPKTLYALFDLYLNEVGIFYTPSKQSSLGCIGITVCLPLHLFAHLSADSFPAHNFFCCDDGIPYLAHGCITMRQCVAYIHDPGTTLTFDLKVKFTGFLTCLPVRPVTFVCFDISILYLAHGSNTMRQCVTNIHDPDTALTFDLNVKIIGFLTWLCVWSTAFFLSFDIVIPYFAHECITIG